MNTILTPPTVPNALQLLQVQAKTLATAQQQAFAKVQQAFSQTLAFVWGDPTKAQERFNAFTSAGFKAADLLTNAGIYAAMINAMSGTPPASPVPAGYSVTANPDGSVTVTRAS